MTTSRRGTHIKRNEDILRIVKFLARPDAAALIRTHRAAGVVDPHTADTMLDMIERAFPGENPRSES